MTSSSGSTPEGQGRVPDASHVTIWRPKLDGFLMDYTKATQRKALAEHFQAISEILESMGERPFGRLELRASGNAFESQVIYRWERPR